jgi:hypothetical protein
MPLDRDPLPVKRDCPHLRYTVPIMTIDLVRPIDLISSPALVESRGIAGYVVGMGMRNQSHDGRVEW